MTTAAYCGTTGSVNGIGEITNWTIKLNQDAPEATSMSSGGWREYVPCLKSGSGTFKSFQYVNKLGLQQSASFKTKASGGTTISGDIVCTDIDLETDVQGLVNFSYTFVFTGAITVS